MHSRSNTTRQYKTNADLQPTELEGKLQRLEKIAK